MPTRTALAAAVVVGLATLASPAFAQGMPSPQGQTVTPEAAASADKAVEKRHDRAVAKANKRAAKKASAASS